MSPLEQRYRRVLRLLPASYRQVWEEDMVDAFLASMTTGDPEADEFAADFGRPSWSEVAAVVGLAVRLRVGGAGAPPRQRAWGEAIRLIALIGLLSLAINATVGIGATLWLQGLLGLPLPAGYEWSMTAGEVAWAAADVVPIIAYLTLVLGYRRIGLVFAVLALLVNASHQIVYLPGMEALFNWAWARLTFDLLMIVALVGFHRDSPPVRRRPWLIAYLLGVILVGVPWYALGLLLPPTRFFGWSEVYGVGVLIAAVVCIVQRNRRASTTLAVAILALGMCVVRALTAVTHRPSGFDVWHTSIDVFAVTEVCLLLLAGVTLTILARGSLRELSEQEAISQQ